MLSLNFQNAIVQDFWQDFIQLRLPTFKYEFIQTGTVVEDLRLRVRKAYLSRGGQKSLSCLVWTKKNKRLKYVHFLLTHQGIRHQDSQQAI